MDAPDGRRWGPLTVSSAARRAILDAVRAAAPRETCGALVWDGRSSRFALLANGAPGRGAYRVEPADLARLVMETRRTGQRVVAWLHSHPGGQPVPSARDIAEAAWPQPYVIAAWDGRRLRLAAYRLRPGRPALAVAVRVERRCGRCRGSQRAQRSDPRPDGAG